MPAGSGVPFLQKPVQESAEGDDRASLAPTRRLGQLGTLAVSLVVVLGSGCGYTLVGKGSAIPEDIRTLYLEPFRNETSRVEVEQAVTQSIATELVTRRRFVLVQNRDEADAVLSGRVTSFRVVPLAFDGEGRAREYEVSVLASVQFVRRGADEPLWQNDRYVFRDNYDVDPSETGFFDRETLAIEETSEKFAETLVSDLLEGF